MSKLRPIDFSIILFQNSNLLFKSFYTFMPPSGPHKAPPPVPEDSDRPQGALAAPATVERDPMLRLEKELLMKIGAVIENNAEISGPINADPSNWFEMIRQFEIIPPMLLKIISINPGTLEPTKPTPDTIAEALSKFIFDLSGKITYHGTRSKLATAILECSTFDQMDELILRTDPEGYGVPDARKINNKALDYTTYYFKLYGPVMKMRGGSSYVYGPRFVASRWVDERNADIALSAFYEQTAPTGIEALREMSNLMTNAKDRFYDSSFGGFDFNNFTRFRLEKKKLPPDRVCPTESWAVTVSW